MKLKELVNTKSCLGIQYSGIIGHHLRLCLSYARATNTLTDIDREIEGMRREAWERLAAGEGGGTSPRSPLRPLPSLACRRATT